jgi:hypothetical protein
VGAIIIGMLIQDRQRRQKRDVGEKIDS